MNTPTKQDFLAFADRLEAYDPAFDSDPAQLTFACITVRPDATEEAAALIRRNARRVWTKECCPSPAKSLGAMGWVETIFNGHRLNAAAAIRRQLEAQREHMDPADVKRCEKAADTLEAPIYLTRCVVYGAGSYVRRKWVQPTTIDTTRSEVRGGDARLVAEALGRETAGRYGGTPTLTLTAEDCRKLQALGFRPTGSLPDGVEEH